MSPLTDGDISELDQWLRAELISSARASLSPNATPQERDETLSIAMREARAMSFVSAGGARAMSTLDGISRVVWQGLRARYPELTHGEVRTLLVDPSTLEHALDRWQQANTAGQFARSNAGGSSPKKARRGRRQRKKKSTR